MKRQNMFIDFTSRFYNQLHVIQDSDVGVNQRGAMNEKRKRMLYTVTYSDFACEVRCDVVIKVVSGVNAQIPSTAEWRSHNGPIEKSHKCMMHSVEISEGGFRGSACVLAWWCLNPFSLYSHERGMRPVRARSSFLSPSFDLFIFLSFARHYYMTCGYASTSYVN